jgi:hypothetical protein
MVSRVETAVFKNREAASGDPGRETKGAGKNSYRGRCDLYFCIGPHSFVCEAKHTWSRIGNKTGSGIKTVENDIKSAWSDSQKLKTRDMHLWLSFVVPCLTSGESTGITESLEEWLKRISEIQVVARAWCFPERMRLLKLSTDSKIYPGVVLLIRG